MAAEVPVCDVLCEAVDYLSKLGSNLRSRSENLKDKRIRKNKLRNAHAVHKAAKKLLLICGLSKKSLENVETGVRKVLATVDAAQAHTDNGGKTIERKSQDSNKNIYYFNYESFKLRISKKISIDHFTSVKVLAEDMPTSMQEKYPVFYDCKLKRLRRNLSKKHTEEEIGRSSKRKDSSCNSDTNQNIGKSKKKQTEFSKLVDSDASESGKSSKNEESRKKSMDSDNNKTVRRQFLDATINSNPADVINDTVPTDSLETQDDSSTCEQGANEQNSANVDSKSRQETISSKEDLAVSELIECFANEAKVVEDKTSSMKTKRREKEATGIRKKFSKIRIADDSSESDASIKNKHENTTQNKNLSSGKENEVNKKNTAELEPKTKKRKLSDTCDNSKSKDDTNHNSTEANNSENDSKPLIRCVNITKLLKPDILDTKTSASSKGKQMTKNNHLMKKGRVRKNSTNCNNAQKVNKSDDEFRALKRNEVKQFKPKPFTVNINKLPQLTISFMLTHNLQKIVHGSKTICEVTKDKDKEKDNLEKNINEVKNALLNESGSEDIDNSLTSEANKVKNTLLNDSDSDDMEQISKNTDNSNQINQDRLTDTAAIKDALLNESDDNGHDKEVTNKTIDSAANEDENELERENAEKIKNALLNDSDSDKNQNDTVVKPNNSDKEKGKQVKSALLKDSDSDKNQNDTVDKPNNSDKEKGKQVKNALLKDSDSDTNQNDNVDKPINSDKEKSMSQNQSDRTEQCESTQDPEKIKSSLLNDSSDSEAKSPVIKKKMSKLERKHAIKSREAKKSLLHYSSSSENEEENSQEPNKDFQKHTHKHTRQKSRISSSSSLNEGNSKNLRSRQESISQEKSSEAHSDFEDKGCRTIDQIDGTIDEQSNSSFSKVRT